MKKIKILIVDDAVVVRRIISDVLAHDPSLEVVGVAANGRIALEKIRRLEPDLITLDIEMPEMDGLQTVTEIRKLYPRLPVIMFSTLTERGAAASLNALALGANDYVTKPSNVGSVSAAMQCLRDDLIPKIKALCGQAIVQEVIHTPQQARPTVAAASPRPVAIKPERKERVDIVAIGVSTGGPNALAEVIPAIPADFPVPIVIVQHMPPLFTRLLAERLDTRSALKVHESVADASIEPGHAWLAPGDFHMQVERSQNGLNVRLNQEAQENSCRPAVDVLFRSVAKNFGPNVLAVIMTGMGQDGLVGCQHIRQAGGQVIVQDEASSVVWGMPGTVSRAGLADQVLPLNQLASEISSRVQYGRSHAAAPAKTVTLS